MAAYFSKELVFDLILFQAVLLGFALSNIWITRRARRHAPPQVWPVVSVLIPARNEEMNIGGCVQSLLAQDYPCYEILVLDDQSSDRTLEILSEIAAVQPRLQVMDGVSPPEGVVGKNWACSQLANRAAGELLLFTDADTRHHPKMLRAVVTAMVGEQADLLTGFPRQLMQSWGERLLVPFFSWVLFSFIPLALAYRLRLPILASAVGQLMLFQREAYQAIGGHARIGASVVDDLSLARRIKAARMRWRVAHIADRVSCRMYRSSREAVEGFTKNLFAVFDYRLLPFLFAFSWLLVLFWEPVILLVAVIIGQGLRAFPTSLAVCLALSLFLFLVQYINIDVPAGLALIYPLTILANAAVAVRSCWHTLAGYTEWKGRRVGPRRWKWL